MRISLIYPTLFKNIALNMNESHQNPGQITYTISGKNGAKFPKKQIFANKLFFH